MQETLPRIAIVTGEVAGEAFPACRVEAGQ